MLNLRLVSIGLILALAGCVSTIPPTAEPTASPTLGITTMAPTTEPTASPTAALTEPPATPEPTTDASPAGSPPASPRMSIQQIFSDDFSDPNSGWGVGSSAAGTVSYSGGTLNFDISQADAWMWSRRIVGESWPLLAVEGVAVPSSDGLFGAMCGTTDDVFVGGVMSTNGAWVFFRIESNTVTVLSSDSTAGLSVPVGLSSSFGIGCSGTDIGAFQMQLALGGTTVASYEGDDGLANFDRVGIYAEASSPDYAVSIDNAVAYGGRQAEGGGMSPAAQVLLPHFDWTDERLSILTTLTDFEGSYPDTFSDWQAAGPN